jgi:hypothetical protein
LRCLINSILGTLVFCGQDLGHPFRRILPIIDLGDPIRATQEATHNGPVNGRCGISSRIADLSSGPRRDSDGGRGSARGQVGPSLENRSPGRWS